LGGVATEHAGGTAPNWAVRATGRTFLNTTGDLVQALAEARDPLEIIRVILDRGDRLAVSRNLPTPVVEVIRQIRATAAQEMISPRLAARRTTDAAHSPSASVLRGRRRARRPPVSTTRVIKSGGSKTASASLSAAGGVSGGKMRQLASRLQSLIRLVQVENRLSDAQRQVRLAAEGAEATSPDQTESGGAQSEAKSGDLEALKREVLNSVSRELELRRERGQEDSDGNWW
jgi:outer membrane murein-binding lipoprotein Lpp